MTEFTRGTTNALTALFYAAPDSPTDVTGLSLSVISLADASVVLGPIIAGFGHPATGVYTYAWAVPAATPIGDYLVTWTGMVGTDPISANEEITIVAEAVFTAGPCTPWPITWPARCDLSAATPEITGIALEAAQEILYQLTAQRFSECEVKLRPCREECFGSGMGWGWSFRSPWWGEYSSYPTPINISGQWYNLGCGSCGTSCSCTAISETFLPGPVVSITEVKVDGVVLVNGVDYRVDDYRKLVRLGAVWPFCNDLNLADTEVGTWSVTAIYGEPVPTLGSLALGELACNFVDFLTGGECELPAGITDLSRQGISMSFANTTTDLTQLFARYPLTYLFIKTYNPNGLMARARAYDLDGPEFRAVGTA